MNARDHDEFEGNMLQRIIDEVTLHGTLHDITSAWRMGLITSVYVAAQNSPAVDNLPFETVRAYVLAYCDAKDMMENHDNEY